MVRHGQAGRDAASAMLNEQTVEGVLHEENRLVLHGDVLLTRRHLDCLLRWCRLHHRIRLDNVEKGELEIGVRFALFD